MRSKKAMERGPGPRRRAGAAPTAALKEDLHVVELGAGVMLDVFINVEGRLTTFVSLDGQLIAELRVAGHV
ncbi:hypothetical protein SOCEGT47_025740 [Sorangium cellulosum]|uniref:Uncharacterized protein n=1 Tax=Sorangium cellulosum TaxID=56 RepID=A0A4P2PZX8_SORCE|nr:hypothetical protein [Sorangium cellulosum]AUX22073.1 hypothetical protein SOCEGT47_025740 [Sorangium cellulosum]